MARDGAWPIAGRRRGFTVVELLVVLAITTVLVTLAVPALRGARFSSKLLRSLAVQRQLEASVESYTQASKDVFPYMATPGDPWGPVIVNGINVSFQGYFTDQSWYWASLIVPDYADVSALDLALTPNVDPRGVFISRYCITETIFADPRLFTTWTARPPLSYLRPTKTPEIQFPAKKGILLDLGLGAVAGESGRQGQLSVAFADGSARPYMQSDIVWSRVVNQPFSNSAKPVINTRNGLAGVDF
jgi:prepilin-type N-terminal cleavage/methylation domain-containing protein